MRVLVVTFIVVIFSYAQVSQAAMDEGYYSTAREVCQLQVQLKTGKRPPVNKEKALNAKVSLINKGENLLVVAWEESGGNAYKCTCTFGPGDADLYPSVRLTKSPSCAAQLPMSVDQRCDSLKTKKEQSACHKEVESMRPIFEAAIKGDLKSQKILGYRYREGDGVRKSKKESLFWYQKAADQGDMDSRIITGGVSDAEILDRLNRR
jgi:hypothetical protein